MDRRRSSLNPYAPAYIPLSKRGKLTEMKLGSNPEKSESPPPSPDEEEIDLSYLATTFPGLSNQSLADVYHANGRDIEASVDMLKHLEVPAEFSPQLPESLDIGDVPENVGEASGSKYVQ